MVNEGADPDEPTLDVDYLSEIVKRLGPPGFGDSVDGKRLRCCQDRAGTVAEALKDKDAFIVIGCRADFSLTAPQELNHWVPCWHRSQLEDWLFEKCHDDAEEQLSAKWNQMQAEILEQDDEVLEESLRFAQAAVSNQMEFWQVLRQHDFLAVEVPADGNCAIWSCISLESGSPPSMNADFVFDTATMMGHRQDTLIESHGAYFFHCCQEHDPSIASTPLFIAGLLGCLHVNLFFVSCCILLYPFVVWPMVLPCRTCSRCGRNVLMIQIGTTFLRPCAFMRSCRQERDRKSEI